MPRHLGLFNSHADLEAAIQAGTIAAPYIAFNASVNSTNMVLPSNRTPSSISYSQEQDSSQGGGGDTPVVDTPLVTITGQSSDDENYTVTFTPTLTSNGYYNTMKYGMYTSDEEMNAMQTEGENFNRTDWLVNLMGETLVSGQEATISCMSPMPGETVSGYIVIFPYSTSGDEYYTENENSIQWSFTSSDEPMPEPEPEPEPEPMPEP